MKKALVVFLTLAMLFASCGTPSNDVVSSTDTSVEDTSLIESMTEESTPSEETSSEPEEEAGPVFREIDGIKYYDVKASGAGDALVFIDPFSGAVTGSHSEYFIDDVEGYYLDDMMFLVDEQTFNKILSKPVAGTGSIKWIGYKTNVSAGDNEKFDGILPVEKMDDPLYVYMCKPSELPTAMGRVNASNMFTEKEGYNYLLPIGAIYNNTAKPIDDDAEFTVCVGRMTLIVYTEKDGWQLVQEKQTPAKPSGIYYLPWNLEKTLGRMNLSDDRVKFVDDHYEVKMTGYELNGAGGKELGATGSVLHFWGTCYEIPEPNTILGAVTSFECWIKEEEMAEYVVAAIGADWKETTYSGGAQVFSGHNYAITTEPRVIFGHNIGPEMYDKIMDTEKVQEMLGLK